MSHAKPRRVKPRSLRPHQRYQLNMVWLLAGTDLLYGGTYIFGGVANSPSQLLMRELMPMSLWGAVLIVGAGLVFARWHSIGGILAGTVWGVFTITSTVSVVQGTAQSSGGPALLLGVTGLHFLITYGAAAGYSDVAR